MLLSVFGSVNSDFVGMIEGKLRCVVCVLWQRAEQIGMELGLDLFTVRQSGLNQAAKYQDDRSGLVEVGLKGQVAAFSIKCPPCLRILRRTRSEL